MKYNDTIKNLIELYINDRDTNKLSEYEEIDLATSQTNREWLRNNILDLEKLKNYSDTEFAQKLFTMYDYMDGSKSSHDRVRCHYFKTTEQCSKIREKFENIISLILNPNPDHSLLLNELMTNGTYKITGLGESTVAQLISAKHENIPFINSRTIKFFRNINSPLSSKLDIKQKEINDFFNKITTDFGEKMSYDDIDHLFWYSQEVESGQNFMKKHFPGSYIPKNPKTTKRRTHKKLTKEEEKEALIAHLQAIQDAANKTRNI